ncbi:MAG: hypothetical protein LBB65_08690 [Burkholderiales bacterium]|jgi:hypothetical protein|nr:hypothetical protein [Burkholderiales bacterium]
MSHQNDDLLSSALSAASAGLDSGTEGVSFVPGGRSVPAKNGLGWVLGAWDLFKRKAGLWTGFAAVYFALIFGATMLAQLPHAAFPVFIMEVFMQMMLIAGVVYSCDLFQRKGSFAFSDFFVAFRKGERSLHLVALPMLGLAILLALSLFGLVFYMILKKLAGAQFMSETAGTMMISLPLAFVFFMGIWFAAALIFMHDAKSFEAIKMSFVACLKNLLPGIVFFLAMGVLWVLVYLLIGLGLFLELIS